MDILPGQRVGCQVLRGDLSNQVSPRLLVTFEGILATISDANKTSFEDSCNNKDYDLALSFFNFNKNVVNRLLYITWKKDYNIEVVTWMNEAMASTIEDYLSDCSIIVRGVTSWNPKSLAHELSYRPDILCIYDADPDHVLLFGSKAVLFTNANQIGV